MREDSDYSVVGFIMEGKPKPRTRKRIVSPEDVVKMLRPLTKSHREVFGIVMLNARHEYMGREMISVGSLNASIVHPREVFKPVFKHTKIAALILFHNHPSGDPDPSEEDIDITKRMVKCGDILGIQILDHVIISEYGSVSLRSRNMM